MKTETTIKVTSTEAVTEILIKETQTVYSTETTTKGMPMEMEMETKMKET